MNRFCFFSSLSLLVGAVLLHTTPIDGCAIVEPKDRLGKVRIATESAIIIYDQASKTEHFIRRASFETDAKDFGFLVPTPSQPSVHEANDEAFNFLAKVTAPEVVEKKRPSNPSCGIGCSADAVKRETAVPAGKVDVLEEKRVGNFETAVLKANDNDKLTEWLKKWGYVLTPEVEKWLEIYTKQGWIITAFKIAKGSPDEKKVASSAVRLSFKTEKPFYPYREPIKSEKADSASRFLRVYFLSDKRMEGGLGDEMKTWRGTTAWAKQLFESQREKVLESLKMPKDTAPTQMFLTEFEDSSSPRDGSEELYFRESADQQNKERPPTIKYVSQDNARGLAYGFVGLFFVPSIWVRVRKWFGKKTKV